MLLLKAEGHPQCRILKDSFPLAVSLPIAPTPPAPPARALPRARLAPPKTPASTASLPPTSPSSARKTSMRSPTSRRTSYPSTGPSLPRSFSSSNTSPSPNGHFFVPPHLRPVSSPLASMRASSPASTLAIPKSSSTRTLNRCLAEGFHRLAARSNGWSLFLRYQARADRSYRRYIEEFERLKANRGELPNEPIVESGPEENTATSSSEISSCETNPSALAGAAPSPAPFTALDTSSTPLRGPATSSSKI